MIAVDDNLNAVWKLPEPGTTSRLSSKDLHIIFMIVFLLEIDRVFNFTKVSEVSSMNKYISDRNNEIAVTAMSVRGADHRQTLNRAVFNVSGEAMVVDIGSVAFW